MLIHDAVKETGLTKKAIEYYVEQGLVSPAILENGYRDFSSQDIERLREIAMYRKLGIGTEDIRRALGGDSKEILRTLSVQKELELQRERSRQAVLDALGSGKSCAEMKAQLGAIEGNETITEKLLEAFPGYYGRFICLHFARFLNEPIKTDAQRAAYARILSFLDQTPALDLPEDLQAYLREGTAHLGTADMTAMLQSTQDSIENPEDFFARHEETLADYLAYKRSAAYADSPACRLMAYMRAFQRTSGYNDVFIPAMRELSPTYAAYYRQMEAASEKLLARYPEMASMDREDTP